VTSPEVPRAVEGRRPRPNVESVQLRGTQLHECYDACSRIVDGSHLRDLEIRVRYGRRNDLFPPLVRFRVIWESDHLAVMSGVASDRREPDPEFHRRIVRLVRRAGERALSEDALAFRLVRIQRIASRREPPDGTVGAVPQPRPPTAG